MVRVERSPEEQVLVHLHLDAEFVGAAEDRIGAELGLSSRDVHWLLSRLFARGAVRLVLRDGVWCYERMPASE